MRFIDAGRCWWLLVSMFGDDPLLWLLLSLPRLPLLLLAVVASWEERRRGRESGERKSGCCCGADVVLGAACWDALLLLLRMT